MTDLLKTSVEIHLWLKSYCSVMCVCMWKLISGCDSWREVGGKGERKGERDSELTKPEKSTS